MINLYWLVVAHFIFDWGFQNRWMAENKSKYWEVLFAHCMIYTGGISIMMGCLLIFEWWKVALVLVSHYIIDFISSRCFKDEEFRYILWVDHLFHFIILLICI